jgi:hypothetical protein
MSLRALDSETVWNQMFLVENSSLTQHAGVTLC